jgi:hypothetical protein
VHEQLHRCALLLLQCETCTHCNHQAAAHLVLADEFPSSCWVHCFA